MKNVILVMSILFLSLLSCNNDDNIDDQKEDTDTNNLQLLVTTLAGDGNYGSTNGIGSSANFNRIGGITVDSTGNVYVADTGNFAIRKVTSSGIVSSFAGIAAPLASASIGDRDGVGTSAQFRRPGGVAVDNLGNIYVADTENHKIRKITPDGNVTTFAGSGNIGNTDGTAASASFNFPEGVTVDNLGNVYVADTNNHKIRKITPDGNVTTFAGSGNIGSINGVSTSAQFRNPEEIAVDKSGNIYVSDYYNHKIRKITPDGNVTTFAGSGNIGDTDGIGVSASFNSPRGVAVDNSENVYLADSQNHKIRKITPDGNVTTLAGDGKSGDIDGLAYGARFRNPSGVAVDNSGNIYVSDSFTKIRKISLE